VYNCFDKRNLFSTYNAVLPTAVDLQKVYPCFSLKSCDLGSYDEMKAEALFFPPQVVAFMNSRLGLYLDDHPFVALSLLMFVAVSTIPVAFFLIFVVTTVIMACVGVIVMEGIVCMYLRIPFSNMKPFPFSFLLFGVPVEAFEDFCM